MVGTGRALAAAARADATVVVTTTGVFTAPPDAGEPIRLDAFTEAVGNVDVVLGPDGRWAAVLLGHPASVRVYDLTRGTRTHTSTLADGQAARLAVTPDGTLVAQGPQNLLAWPDGPGTAPVVLVEGRPLGRAAVLADGTVVAPARDNPELLVGPPTAPLAAQPLVGVGDGRLVDAATSPSGSLVVSVARGADEFSRTDELAWVDTETWAVVRAVATGIRTEHSQWAAFDAGVAVAGDAATSVFASTGELIGEAPGGASAVYTAGSHLVTFAPDATVAFWDPAAPAAPVHTEPAPPLVGPVVAGTERVAAVGFYGHVGVWDPATGAATPTDARFATGELTSIAVSTDGWVTTGSSVGVAQVYDATLTPVGTVDEGRRRIDAVGFVPGTHDLVTALSARVGQFAFDDSVARWNGPELAEAFRIAGAGQDVPGCAFFYNRVRFSPDGTLLAHVRHTFEVELVDVATGMTVHTFPAHGAAVFDIAFDAAGHLVSTADDATVRVWNLADRALVAEYPAAPGGYTSLVPLGNGTLAVTGIVGNVSLVDTLTGAVVAELPTSAARTGRPAASPDGSLLAVPSLDGSVGVWSLADHALIATLTGPTGPVSELVFADAATLLGAGQDGTLHHWVLDA